MQVGKYSLNIHTVPTFMSNNKVNRSDYGILICLFEKSQVTIGPSLQKRPLNTLKAAVLKVGSFRVPQGGSICTELL